MAIATTEPLRPVADDWAGAIRQRRKALPQRLAMAAASALVFSTIIGWPIIGAWLVFYLLIQILDHLVFLPITSGRVEHTGRLLTAVGCGMIFLNAAAFGALSIPLWLVAGPAGGVCAAILLAGGAIYSVINSPGSARALICTLSAQLIYLMLTPVFLVRAGATMNVVSAASVAVVVYAFYCISTWSRMEKSRLAETAARVEADRKRADAERIMGDRSTFLATVGHDLRTPISAILTGAAELERGAGDGSARAQARLITDAGEMMKALLDDLLDHARLEAGHLKVETVDFNLRDLLTQTVGLWQAPARAKGLKLRVEGARHMPISVRGDAMRLRQVLNNLMSNALKFTNEGAITLRLNGWAEEPAGYALLIEVADTGPGMTAPQVARLFTPFDQISDGVSARHGGSGLGLAISRQIAELMGGRLTARSEPGQGARFTLALRLEQGETVPIAAVVSLSEESRKPVARVLVPSIDAADAAPPLVSTPLETPPDEPAFEDEEDEGRPMRVLVVDDHDINRRAIQLILQPLGCDIATAADGLAALKICEADAFDLIFMDVRMPELDGRETTRRIRAGDGPNANVPIIAVTADTSPEDIAECTAAGMTYFVPKPITPPLLLGAVNQVLMAQDEGVSVAA